MTEIPSIDFMLILPVIIVAGTGTLLMIVDMFASEEQDSWAPILTITGLIASLAFTLLAWNNAGSTFTPTGGSPMIVVDNFATFLNATFLLTGILTIFLSLNYLKENNLNRPEYYMLILFSVAGMMLMGMSNDLITIFISLELLSIPLYILSGFAWPKAESEESAMKYFLLGAFSSGILVYGIALMYGATGSTALPEIFAALDTSSGLAMMGIAMLLVGFAFKVAAVPFHMWTPDVYQGAPTAVTAFMSVGAKVAGFAALLRIFTVAFPSASDVWAPALGVMAAITMILGNVVALSQQNIKRMLAYSSIAHAGYILMAISAIPHSPDGTSAALFYMFAYLFSNLGAFAVIIAVERKDDGVMLENYKGLAKSSPLLALAMAYFMLSLTGVPPTGGFSGKFFVFRTVMEAEMVWLAVIGVVTSVVSGYFYLRVVFLMYMFDGEGNIKIQPAIGVAVAVTVIATVLLGVWPTAWYDIAREAVIQGANGLLTVGG